MCQRASSGRSHPIGLPLQAFDLHPRPWRSSFLADEQVYIILDASGNPMLELPLDDFPQWDFTPVDIVNLLVKSINGHESAILNRTAFALACNYISTTPQFADKHPDFVSEEFLAMAKISIQAEKK